MQTRTTIRHTAPRSASAPLGQADLEMLRGLVVEFGGRSYAYDASAFLVVNPSPAGLNEALARLPGDFAHWAYLESLAKVVQEEVENERAVKAAQLYAYYEASLARTDTDGKRAKPTVDTIKAQVTLNQEYQNVLSKQRQANQAVNVLMSMRQAMQNKKDVVLAIASNYRAERDSYMHDQLRTIRDRVHSARPAGQ